MKISDAEPVAKAMVLISFIEVISSFLIVPSAGSDIYIHINVYIVCAEDFACLLVSAPTS